MPNPVFIFALMIATLYGLGFHLLMGGGGRRLALFIAASWLGFWLGQYIGSAFEIHLFKIGIIRLLPATLGALVALISAHLLTSGASRRASRR